MANSTNNGTNYIVNLEKNNLYDYALLILWLIASFSVLVAAILSKKEFLIM